MSNVPITVAHGDGIGPEIMDATLHILKEAGARIDIETIEIGEKVYLAGNTAALPGAELFISATAGVGSRIGSVVGRGLGLLGLRPNADVAEGAAVQVAATGTHDVDTTAIMSASGGVAVTPVVSMAFVHDTTRALIAAGATVTAADDIGIEATQDEDVTTDGKGDTDVVASNDTVEGRAMNRRVEFTKL